MKIIRFRKIFQYLTERDEGYEMNAICAYSKRPLIMHTRVLSREEAKEKGFQVIVEPLTYRCSFFLDLWFFTIYKSWEQNA